MVLNNYSSAFRMVSDKLECKKRTLKQVICKYLYTHVSANTLNHPRTWNFKTMACAGGGERGEISPLVSLVSPLVSPVSPPTPSPNIKVILKKWIKNKLFLQKIKVPERYWRENIWNKPRVLIPVNGIVSVHKVFKHATNPTFIFFFKKRCKKFTFLDTFLVFPTLYFEFHCLCFA